MVGSDFVFINWNPKESKNTKIQIRKNLLTVSCLHVLIRTCLNVCIFNKFLLFIQNFVIVNVINYLVLFCQIQFTHCWINVIINLFNNFPLNVVLNIIVFFISKWNLLILYYTSIWYLWRLVYRCYSAP